MKKGDLINLLDKWGDDDIIRFFTLDKEEEVEIDTLEEPVNANEIWINLIKKT